MRGPRRIQSLPGFCSRNPHYKRQRYRPAVLVLYIHGLIRDRRDGHDFTPDFNRQKVVLPSPASNVGLFHVRDNAGRAQLGSSAADDITDAAGSPVLVAELEIMLVAIENHFHSRALEQLCEMPEVIQAGRMAGPGV